jgi:hypothetical protein
VHRLEHRPETPPTTRARLFLEDGLRLASADSARAESRLRQAAQVDSAGDAGDGARLRLTRLSLTRATSVSELPRSAKELDERIERKSVFAGEAGQPRWGL